jgi:hypothetical protein
MSFFTEYAQGNSARARGCKESLATRRDALSAKVVVLPQTSLAVASPLKGRKSNSAFDLTQ